MNRAESDRIVRAKEGPCIACVVLHQRDELPEHMVVVGCDYHHMKSGNVRRGHMFGVALCVWHHRRHPWGDWTFPQMRKIYGPSLMDGSALFHRTYGSDDWLLAKQAEVLGVVQLEDAA